MKKLTKVPLALEGHIVVSPNVHDCNIFAITVDKVDKHRNLIVDIICEYGDECKKYRLHFISCDWISFSDFMLGNIIDEINIYTGQLARDYFYNGIGLKKFKSVSEFWPSRDDEIEPILRKIINGDRMYVYIQTSYGCEAYIICRKIEAYLMGEERGNNRG